MRVPFVDLGAQYATHKAELDAALAGIIERSAFIGGAAVREFEQSFAKKYGVGHCVSCANGTDAIYVALRMLGIGPGDEVITTATSWIATSETISQTGARPVFVDVDEYFNLDADLLEDARTDRTRAVIVVHLYGQAANMAGIMSFCDRHGLLLVEDCAQSHFAAWNGQRVGTMGNVGTFSFYPGKNLGAWGDAGAIVTNDEELATRCRMFTNHGALVKHQHEMEGINSRLDGIQAAILGAKLPHIDKWTASRRRVAAQYDELLAGIGDLQLPRVRDGASHVYHLYVIKTAHRDELGDYLRARDIQTGIHYPTALPLLPAYSHLGMTPASIPRAASNQDRILSLPMYPELSRDMIEFVADSIRSFFDAHPSSG
jgi:dTDP-4-amino-4,6-dideoxygalactose transaminase